MQIRHKKDFPISHNHEDDDESFQDRANGAGVPYAGSSLVVLSSLASVEEPS